jgi:hypothetical protein
MSVMPQKMLILRGIAGTYDGIYWPKGALYEQPAKEYAHLNGYDAEVLDVAGATGEHNEQTRMALERIHQDPTITALYGFSGGGYNILRIIKAMDVKERARLRLLVVLGAPKNDESWYDAKLFGGSWKVVYKKDPPAGHMDGPRALLATTAAQRGR